MSDYAVLCLDACSLIGSGGYTTTSRNDSHSAPVTKKHRDNLATLDRSDEHGKSEIVTQYLRSWNLNGGLWYETVEEA